MKLSATRVRNTAGARAISEPQGQRRVVGGIGGGRSAFFVYPDEDVAVILMTNLVGANPQNLIDTIAGHYTAEAPR